MRCDLNTQPDLQDGVQTSLLQKERKGQTKHLPPNLQSRNKARNPLGGSVILIIQFAENPMKLLKQTKPYTISLSSNRVCTNEESYYRVIKRRHGDKNDLDNFSKWVNFHI